MTAPLNRQDAKHITGILNAASQIVASAQGFYSVGLLSEQMVTSVLEVQGDLGRFLAFFEDGKGYGWAKPSALDHMRELEDAASELLYLASRDAIECQNARTI